MTEPPSLHAATACLSTLRDGDMLPDDEWVPRLSSTGATHHDAISRLRELMLRSARHQVSRMPQATDLGATRREEIVQSAANDATLSVLSRLDTFEGRSRFTTWAYKFGIFQAGAEVRRAAWSGREVPLHDVPVIDGTVTASPEAHAEARDLATAVRDAMLDELTPHQRRVAIALLVDETPIDVLASRLDTTRGALYKTLHDARRRLRARLRAEGRLEPTQEVTR